jgi:hypothetical protein
MSVYTYPQRRAIQQSKLNADVLASTYANTPLYDMIGIIVGKIGSDILAGTLTINTIINSGTPFTMASKGVTVSQLREFGRRAVRGALTTIMSPIIMDEASFDNILDGATDPARDLRFYNTMLRVVWVAAKDIIV